MHDLTIWKALGIWVMMTLLIAQAVILAIAVFATAWGIWMLVT